MEKEKFLSYTKEIILFVLREAINQQNKFKEIGDLSGEEILEEKVILPYEKIYKALATSDVKSLGEEEYKYLEKMVEEIKEKNKITSEEIEALLKKREEYKGKSGAEVVKKFFRYNLNRALEKKDKISEKYLELVKEEEKLDLLLKDSIQEQEQFDIIYKLQPVREKIREVEKKYLEIENEVKKIKSKLDSEWPYEIYGTISEEELLKTYKTMFNMEA